MNKAEKEEREKRSARIVVGGIVTLLACFIIGLTSLAIRSINSEVSLVTDEYYQKGISYQDEIDALNLAKKLPERPEINSANGMITVAWPQSLAVPADAKISLYRPSNPDGDEEVQLVLDSDSKWQKKLAPGRWNVTVSWRISGTYYCVKEKVFL